MNGWRRPAHHLDVLLRDESQLVLHASEGVGQFLVLPAQPSVLVQQGLVLALGLPQTLELRRYTCGSGVGVRAHTKNAFSSKHKELNPLNGNTRLQYPTRDQKVRKKSRGNSGVFFG